MAGFKKAEQTDIVLAVGDRARVDFKMEIGTAQESVTVEASPVAVQSESGEISDVISGAQLSQLAANGRSLYSLAIMTAGASSNMADYQSATPVGGDANVSFNGLRTSHNIYLIDGGENLDRGGSGNISVMPSMDAIAEFRQLTSNYVLRRHHDDGLQVRLQGLPCLGLGVLAQRRPGRQQLLL
jgi:hypothetical protein